MKPRITLITLGVDDLPRAVRFYRDGLGLATDGIVGEQFEFGAVAFFELQSGLTLALWPRQSLVHDTGIACGTPNPTEFSIGHNVSSKAHVDVVMHQAEQAGALMVKPARDTFWGGYAGYFQDPDGHLWEIAWNPQWEARNPSEDRMTSRSSERPAVGVAHVVLHTDRMEESARFMRTVGMRAIFDGPQTSVYEMRGGTHLILIRSDGRTAGDASFDLMVDDLHATHQRLTALGLSPSPIEARPAIDHEVFTVREPAGHSITFFSSHASGLPT